MSLVTATSELVVYRALSDELILVESAGQFVIDEAHEVTVYSEVA
jgi:hypothetical protein